MNGISRAPATLLGAALAGVLLWLATQIGRHATGGYWAAYAIVAAAGFVLALSQLRGRTGHPPAMFLLGFLPVLVVGGWILLGMQPHPNWFRTHVLSWSGDLHVRHLVTDLGTWLGVIAFGIGYTLGATIEPAPRRAVAAVPVSEYDRRATDEPTTAERREVAATEPAPVDEPVADPAPSPATRT